MNVPSIKTYALGTAYSKTVEDADFLVYLQIEHAKLADIIKTYVKNDFFYETFTTDLVANQNEYSFPKATATDIGIERILSADVNLKEDNDPTTQDQRINYNVSSNTSQNMSLDSQEKYGNRYFDIKDSSLFLYPTPKYDIVGGLKVQAIVSLNDLAIDSAEDVILNGHTEFRKYHYIIGIGIRKHVFQAKGLYKEKDKSIEEYNDSIELMITSLRGRYEASVTQERPNLSHLAR